MTAHRFSWPMALLAAGLAACSQPPVPPDTFYRLEPPTPPASMAKPRIQGSLAVERFNSDALIAGRAIVHRAARPPQELVEYHYHFWTQSPTLMLRDSLVDYLRAANVASMVVTPELRVDSDQLLIGTIKRLEKVDGSPAMVVAELEFALKERTGSRLGFLKTYRADAPADDDSVAAAVLAMNTAVRSVFEQLLADLARP